MLYHVVVNMPSKVIARSRWGVTHFWGGIPIARSIHRGKQTRPFRRGPIVARTWDRSNTLSLCLLSVFDVAVFEAEGRLRHL